MKMVEDIYWQNRYKIDRLIVMALESETVPMTLQRTSHVALCGTIPKIHIIEVYVDGVRCDIHISDVAGLKGDRILHKKLSALKLKALEGVIKKDVRLWVKQLSERTRIFKTREDFEDREESRDVNGVSPDFAEKHPNFRTDNFRNYGCWNCKNSYWCVNSFNLVGCVDRRGVEDLDESWKRPEKSLPEVFDMMTKALHDYCSEVG
jgi:hypothetical protein